MQSVSRAALREMLNYDPDGNQRIQRAIGLGALAVVVILAAILIVVYTSPPGRTVYTATMTSADSIKVGDEIRVAGITVGSVGSITLQANTVDVDLSIEDSVFVGEQSSLDVRLLTPIGGSYIALHPAGQDKLGDGTIPPDRVRLPYNLSQAIQDSERPVAGIDQHVTRSTITSLTESLRGAPGAVPDFVGGLAAVSRILDEQDSDIQDALTISDEYVGVLTQTRSVIGEMFRKFRLMENQLIGKRAELLEALDVAAQIFSRIAAAEPSYRSHLEPIADRLVAALPELRALATRLGPMVDSVAAAGNRFASMVTPDGVRVDHSASTGRPVCVPVPGRAC